MKKMVNWGVGIATVYTIFAGATLGFVSFAMQQPVDLVSPEYYANAQAHDERQVAAERALMLGDAFRISTESSGRSVTIVWPATARPDSGRITLYRPSDSRADRTEPARADAQGVQVIHVADLAAGNWTVQCEWKSGRELFYAERQVVVR